MPPVLSINSGKWTYKLGRTGGGGGHGADGVYISASTRCCSNACMKLSQRRRRWANIKPSLDKRLVFAVMHPLYMDPAIKSVSVKRSPGVLPAPRTWWDAATKPGHFTRQTNSADSSAVEPILFESEPPIQSYIRTPGCALPGSTAVFYRDPACDGRITQPTAPHPTNGPLQKKTLLNLPLTWLRWYFRGRFFRQLWVPRVWDRWFHVCHFYVPWCWVVEKKRLRPQRWTTTWPKCCQPNRLAALRPSGGPTSETLAHTWTSVQQSCHNPRTPCCTWITHRPLHLLKYTICRGHTRTYPGMEYQQISGQQKSQRQSRGNYNNNNNKYVTGWKLNCVFSFTRACELGYPMFQVL